MIQWLFLGLAMGGNFLYLISIFVDDRKKNSIFTEVVDLTILLGHKLYDVGDMLL